MKYTYNIRMRVVLWAMLGIACLAPAPALAQGRDMGCSPTLANPCSGGSTSRGSSSGSTTPSYDYGAARRTQEAEAAAAERQRQAEAERIERERLVEEKRKKDAEFIRNRDATASTLKGSSGEAMSQLKGLSGADSSSLKGSGFDTGNTGLKELRGSDRTDRQARPQPAPHTDTSVVDARVPRDGAYLTNQVPELKHSPAADRITKGFQAVINHDWPVALAWWQDALNRDPNNAALKRSVDLAQWMVDRRKAGAAGPVTPLGAAIHNASRGDNAGAIRQFELAKAENPAIAPQADHMINTLRQQQAKDAKAANWRREIEKQTRQIVDGLRETGMNRLSIGDEKGAQDAFRDADFFAMGLPAGEQKPSQMSASKSGKTK